METMLREQQKGSVGVRTILDFSFALSQIHHFRPRRWQIHVLPQAQGSQTQFPLLGQGMKMTNQNLWLIYFFHLNYILKVILGGQWLVTRVGHILCDIFFCFIIGILYVFYKSQKFQNV